MLSQLADGIDPNAAAKHTEKSRELESQGVLVWLTTLFPHMFVAEFSEDHKRFWRHWWSVMMRIREIRKYETLGLPVPKRFTIEPKELIIFLLLGRALGKSVMVEVSAIGRGALLDAGYALYLCESQDQANEHLGNMRGLIEHPDSRLTDFYPRMAIAEGTTIGNLKAKDRETMFICKNGFIGRSKGLEAKLRGLRMGSHRPDDVNIDDIDDVGDSIAVSVKKLRRLLSSVGPLTGNVGHATFKFGQNLILETGVINQLHTGKADGFVERTTFGVSNTFEHFREGIEFKTYLDDEDGRIKRKILPAAKPTWPGVSIEVAQQFLNNSGLETFLAEYQNQFDHLKTDKVFFAFDEARHIVEWSDFERVFGVRYIPAHWQAKATADFGYSKKSLSAWLFTASAAQNAPDGLASHYFCYRSLSFMQKSIDDQAVAVWESMFPDIGIGKRHFEATQEFADYPELFRMLKTKSRCLPFMDDKPMNTRRMSEPSGAVAEEEYWSLIAQQKFAGQIADWRVSHEKTGEQRTLAQKYGLPVNKTKNFGASDGVAEANHLLRGDFTKPHPFFEDEKLANGLYKLGRPFIYFIVEDGQKLRPVNDAGMKIAREQIANQRMTEEKLGELGLTRSIPMKYESDVGDAFRMFAVSYAMPQSTERTLAEQIDELIPESVKPKIREDGSVGMTMAEQQRLEFAKRVAEETLKEKYGDGIFEDEDEDEGENWWDD